MMRLCLVLSLAVVGCAAAAGAQTVQNGAAEPVKPATQAPQTEQQPNLRTDAQPQVSISMRTDSGPLPETLGTDATPYVELGPDWSLPARDNETSITKEIVTSKKGVISVRDMTTHGVTPLPITNPPVPVAKTITNIPDPPVKHMPTPPNPLTAIPQPDQPVAP